MKIICDSEEQKREVLYWLCDICPSRLRLRNREDCGDMSDCEGCWLDSGLELVLKKDEPKVAYLCDQKECVVCINPRCHHTCNIRHAVNFENLGDNHYMEKEQSSR